MTTDRNNPYVERGLEDPTQPIVPDEVTWDDFERWILDAMERDAADMESVNPDNEDDDG